MIRVPVLYFRYSLECNIPENQLLGGIHENVHGLLTTNILRQSRSSAIALFYPCRITVEVLEAVIPILEMRKQRLQGYIFVHVQKARQMQNSDSNP